MTPALLWFRQDLRLQDNPALNAALERGGAVVPVYIHDEAGEGPWAPGGAARWWLHHSLVALDETLRAVGSRLIVATGDSATVLRQLAASTGAGALYWNRRYEPVTIARDRTIKSDFSAAGLDVKSFNGALLHEPHWLARHKT